MPKKWTVEEFRKLLEKIDNSNPDSELPRGNPQPQTREGYYEHIRSHFGDDVAKSHTAEWDKYHKKKDED